MKLLKFIFLIGAIMSLAACYYDSTSNCLKLPQAVYCPKNKQIDLDFYSKKTVSDAKKIQDMQECLGDDSEDIPDKHGSIFGSLEKKYPHSNDGWKKNKSL